MHGGMYPAEVEFLDKWVAGCLQMKRRSLGLTQKDRAMLICDRAPSHLHRGFLQLRKNFCIQHNVVIFGSDPDADIQVPRHIGMWGSMNDGYHQFIHALRQVIERERMGLGDSLHQRRTLKEVGVDPAGVSKRDINYKDAILNDALAIQSMANYKCIRDEMGRNVCSKIVLYVWLLYGVLTPELAAEWHFGGDIAALEEYMKGCRGEFYNVAKEATVSVVETIQSARQATWASLCEKPLEGALAKFWVFWKLTGFSPRVNTCVFPFVESSPKK